MKSGGKSIVSLFFHHIISQSTEVSREQYMNFKMQQTYRLRITKQAGEGTFGLVYFAVDEDTETEFAIKVPKSPSSDTTKELRMLKFLHNNVHDNVVRFFGAIDQITDDGSKNTCLVFERMEMDLFTVLATYKLSDCHKISFSYQLLKGMAHLHGLRVVHRDLKPANILLTSGNVLKISDFGSACRLPKPGDDRKLSNDVTTLWYRAPELIVGVQDYGQETDMWSVG